MATITGTYSRDAIALLRDSVTRARARSAAVATVAQTTDQLAALDEAAALLDGARDGARIGFTYRVWLAIGRALSQQQENHDGNN